MKKTGDQTILNFLSRLKSADPSEYVSGEFLARQAGISRSAVWKQILMLRRYGYGIISVRGQGYKFVSDTELPLPWELEKRVRTSVLGKKVVYLDVTDSTQRVALSIANTDNKANGTVIIADHQKGGRGRQKRKWISPAGGLWFSVILRPEIPTATVTLLPLLAALAVREALEKDTRLYVRLKWPNDIMISGKKVAGILLDISAEVDVVNYVVIGVGINVNVNAIALAEKIDRPQEITSMENELGHKVSRLNLLQLVLENLENYLDVLRRGGGGEIVSAWKQNTDMIGRKVSVSQDGRILYEGVARDLDHDGSLVIDTDSGKVRISSGDISVRY